MSTFVASSGVELDENGVLVGKPPDGGYEAVHEARKEFYQHLRDRELGQTREGNIVVQPLGDNAVLVRDETTGEAEKWYRDQISRFTSVFGHGEAKRHFEAHPEPEPKPWHSAIEGDLWEVGYSGPAFIAMVSDKAEFIFTDKTSVPITAKSITAGARLWPEGE